MLIHPDFDPVIFTLGPLAVRWYGMMYLVGFVGGWWLGRIRAAKPDSGWSPSQIDDLLFYIMIGVVLGGRVGSTLFYHLPQFLHDPLLLFRIWEGGMSFHGGFLGVLFAMWLYGRKHQRHFFELTDFIAPFVTIGLGAGRIGNFINQELVGRPTDLPWGVVFPKAYDGIPRHPSQLYEAALEGLALFLILWFFSARPRPMMATSALFLIAYGIFRFAIEFVREPDAHIGFIAFGWLTMGQLLSIPMILIGIWMFWFAYRRARAR
ncbi:MAG: prolipoprotein diacylglyceryl transferase [Gammaproteobacteria bacterium]|nr:MAG: prolipoprotein diacylglyceryl transferase [Gammaproteobacteria bacterium]